MAACLVNTLFRRHARKLLVGVLLPSPTALVRLLRNLAAAWRPLCPTPLTQMQMAAGPLQEVGCRLSPLRLACVCHPRCGPCEVTGELATSKDAHPSDGFKKYIGGGGYFSLSSVLDQCVRLLDQLLSYV